MTKLIFHKEQKTLSIAFNKIDETIGRIKEKAKEFGVPNRDLEPVLQRLNKSVGNGINAVLDLGKYQIEDEDADL